MSTAMQFSSGVLCTPWGFAELTICTPTPSEIPCHPGGHLGAALPTESDKSQPTVLPRLQLKRVKGGLRCLLPWGLVASVCAEMEGEGFCCYFQ